MIAPFLTAEKPTAVLDVHIDGETRSFWCELLTWDNGDPPTVRIWKHSAIATANEIAVRGQPDLPFYVTEDIIKMWLTLAHQQYVLGHIAGQQYAQRDMRRSLGLS